jgi:hypothetical protein
MRRRQAIGLQRLKGIREREGNGDSAVGLSTYKLCNDSLNGAHHPALQGGALFPEAPQRKLRGFLLRCVRRADLTFVRYHGAKATGKNDGASLNLGDD